MGGTPTSAAHALNIRSTPKAPRIAFENLPGTSI
jgi:hypothetical protein